MVPVVSVDGEPFADKQNTVGGSVGRDNGTVENINNGCCQVGSKILMEDDGRWHCRARNIFYYVQ